MARQRRETASKGGGDFKIRTPAKLHADLKDAAEKRGVSLNVEIIERLERSFGAVSIEDLGGPRLAEIIKVIAQAMKVTGTFSATLVGAEHRGGAWLLNPWAFVQASTAAARVLDAFRPPGDATPPKATDLARELSKQPGHGGEAEIQQLEASVPNVGEMFAKVITRYGGDRRTVGEALKEEKKK